MFTAKAIAVVEIVSHYLCVYRYVDVYRLPEPCDDIQSVLDSVGKRIGAIAKGM